MKISTSKSEAMVFKRNKVECLLRVKEEILPQVEAFKYLGVLFTSEGRMEQEIDRWIGAVSAVMQTLQPVSQSVSQPASQPASQPVSQTMKLVFFLLLSAVCQTSSQSVSQSASQPAPTHLIQLSVRPPVSQSAGQPATHLIQLSVRPPVCHWMKLKAAIFIMWRGQ
ncbi:hypothetical protein D4764_04G0015070 [Takifugu flavidus]|uniref:Uncharacterized protein n=1 Tax=Takifugu flavidus TaxID=433684 RepID=A0A5C6NAD3_9TELE|nr:hypothetical protein D4764_04G0015070 [Takifugu flavidus]